MTRVAIVGAGVVGLSAAYALRQSKNEVTLVDRGPPGSECSHGNAGWICPSFSGPLPSPGLGLNSLVSMLRRDSPLHIDLRALPRLAPWLWRFWRHCNVNDYARGLAALATLNEETMSSFDAWAADGVTFEMHRSGMLWAFLDPRRVESATRDFIALERLGYRVPEPLDGDAVRKLEPNLGSDVRGGFLVGEERHVRPETLIEGLTQRVTELGVSVRSGITVTSGKSLARSMRCLHTSDGDLHADVFLLATGAWSGQLARKLGSTLPVEAGKGYSITLPNPSLRFNRSLYFAEVKAAVSPFDSNLRIAGTMELSGVNTRLEPDRVSALRRSADRYFRSPPEWGAGEAWVGARPITPDGLPLIGRLPGFDNVFVATGHGMMGLTLAPVTGELIAKLIQGRLDSATLKAFDPAR